MLEIATNNVTDTKLVDGSSQHLSSVNDHRVLLSSVDPTTNCNETGIDQTISRKCGGDKETTQFNLDVINSGDRKSSTDVKGFHSDCLGVEEIAYGHDCVLAVPNEGDALPSEKIEELGKFDQVNLLDTMPPKDPTLNCIKDVKPRYKVGKRRRRAPWGSEYNKKQRNPRRLPRSEMPHEELLKLREKERKAQKIRREHLKKAEETRLQMMKEKTVVANTENEALEPRIGEIRLLEKFCQKGAMSSEERSLAFRNSRNGDSPVERDAEENTLETDANSSLSSLDHPIYFDGKLPFNCVIKEKFMHALGLQQRYETDEGKSLAALLANNVEATANDSSCFSGEETFFQTRPSKRPLCDYDSEKSYQSLSEETSDCSDKKANTEGFSRRMRRSSLSKEELERLREKERLAKRRQRAKNRKDAQQIESGDLNFETYGDGGLHVKRETGSCIENSIDTESIVDSAKSSTNWKLASCGYDNTEGFGNNDVKEKKEPPTKQNDGRRKVFPRYYDRSRLSAEELESLRRREREYQRKRRARLREAKLKAIGQIPKESKTLDDSQLAVTEEAKVNEDLSKKYETRMSKGISRPSLRFLEHSSVTYYENELNEGQTDLRREAGRKISEEGMGIDCDSSISMVHKKKFSNIPEDLSKPDKSNLELCSELHKYPNQISDDGNTAPAIESMERQTEMSRSDIAHVQLSPANEIEQKSPTTNADRPGLIFMGDKKINFNEVVLKRQLDMCDEKSKVPVSAKSSSPVVDALYASDYKILEANGYRSMKSEPERHYCDTQQNNRRMFDFPSWHSKAAFSPDISKYVNRQNESVYQNNRFDYEFGAFRPKEIADERKEDVQMNVKKDGESCGDNKWRHWKSGLTDSQLQRRRQSNREAQRRRRMRLRLMQMKSLQEQDQVPFEEIMYKRFTPNKRVMVNEAMKAFHVSKGKLKNMLERRHRVFVDAQTEERRSEMESKSSMPGIPEQPKKGRGCRIKVTPKRQVIVPSMGFPPNVGITEKAGPTSDDVYLRDFQINNSRFNMQFNDFTDPYLDHNGFEEQISPEPEEQAQQTSSRKRKQFCPRRLLCETERSSHENVPSLVTAL